MSVTRTKACATAFVLAALALGSTIGPAVAQDASSYPVAGRTVRLITPHGSGSGADILARLVAPKLAERWKVTTVTDVWTFARDISSRDPNWKLVATEAGQ